MKTLKLRKKQHGLSLLMKMIVIAILGIVTQVALTTYQEHVAHEKTVKQ